MQNWLQKARRALRPPAAFAVAFVRALRGDRRRVDSDWQALAAENASLRAECGRLAQALQGSRDALTPSQADRGRAQAAWAAAEPLAACDAEGRLMLNPAARALCGDGPPEETPEAWAARVSLRYPSGQPVPPGSVPLASSAHGEAPSSPAEFWLRTADGKDRRILVTVRVMAGAAAASLRDVTPQRRAEERLLYAGRRGDVLAQIGRGLSESVAEGQLAQAVTEGALALLSPGAAEGARALLYAYGGRGGPLTLLEASPDMAAKKPRTRAHAPRPEFAFDAQSPLLWKLYIERDVVICPSPDTDPLMASSASRVLLHGTGAASHASLGAAVLLPLVHGTTAVGHLCITCPQAGALADADAVDSLSLLASLAALAWARQRTAAEARQGHNRLDALSAALAAASDAGNAAWADTLAALAAGALGADAAVLAMIGAGGAGLHVLGTHDDEARHTLPSLDTPDGGCACGRLAREALARGLPSALTALPNPTLFTCPLSRFSGQSGTHSALSVPLLRGGDACGVLSLYRAGRAPFSPEEVALAETFAALAALRASSEF